MLEDETSTADFEDSALELKPDGVLVLDAWLDVGGRND